MNNTPYSNLNPDLILEAIDHLGFKCDGSIVALNSYENRVYQVGMEEAAPLIAKFYRPLRWSNAGILEEHAFAAELMSHEIPVVGPLSVNGQTLHTHQDYRFTLFPRQGGRALELDNLEQLEWMGRFIGRLHAVSACQPFQHRLTLDVTSYGHQPYQFLLTNDFLPAEIKTEYNTAVTELLEKIQQQFLQVGKINVIRLHGDCHAGNVLWNTNGPQIVDLDDCLMGPAVQDIWMMLTSNTEPDMQIQLDHILRGYRKFYDFNPRELHLIESLRSLRMLHYSAWLAKRWEDPAFPLNFPWFNTLDYWRRQLQHLHEQSNLINQSYEL